MRKLIANVLLILSLLMVLQIITAVVKGVQHEVIIPTFFLIPGMVSTILCFLFAANTLYYAKVENNWKINYLLCIGLTGFGVLLLVIGNGWTDKVSSIDIVPGYLKFYLPPLLVLPLSQVFKRKRGKKG